MVRPGSLGTLQAPWGQKDLGEGAPHVFVHLGVYEVLLPRVPPEAEWLLEGEPALKSHWWKVLPTPRGHHPHNWNRAAPQVQGRARAVQ